MLVALAARAAVPVPAAILPRLAWGLVVSAVATATLFAVAAAMRRLLPLAALLRLSLAFPTPGLLTPVVDPVTDDVVDPLVDTVDGLVPGLFVGDTVNDLRCLLPLLGCP